MPVVSSEIHAAEELGRRVTNEKLATKCRKNPDRKPPPSFFRLRQEESGVSMDRLSLVDNIAAFVENAPKDIFGWFVAKAGDVEKNGLCVVATPQADNLLHAELRIPKDDRPLSEEAYINVLLSLTEWRSVCQMITRVNTKPGVSGRGAPT